MTKKTLLLLTAFALQACSQTSQDAGQNKTKAVSDTVIEEADTTTAVAEIAPDKINYLSVVDEDTGEELKYLAPLPPPGKSEKFELYDQCGPTLDYVDVESYKEKLKIPKTKIDDLEDRTIVIVWMDKTKIESLTGANDVGTVAGAKYCTGTFISSNLVITAGHCFDKSGPGLPDYNPTRDNTTPYKVDAAGNVTYIEPADLAKGMFVQEDYQFKATTGTENKNGNQFPIEELVEYRLGGLDYAIVRVNTGDNDVPIINISKKDLAIGNKAIVIQHPKGLPKKVDVGKITKKIGVAVLYDDLDTDGGSSGAGVLDKDGNLRAVHFGGHCGFGAKIGNMATRIERLVKASPTLKQMTNPTP